jgi:predicted permease
MFSNLLFRFRSLFHRKDAEAELDAELQFHFDHELEKNLQAGVTREEAVRRARIAFGGLAQVKEDCRVAWGTTFLETLLQDLGYGARLLLRSPGFTAVALLTLTLGIGATTAIFSVVDAVLLRPLPYRDSQRLVSIYEDHGGGKGLSYDFDTPGGYVDLKKQTQVFDDVAAIDAGNGYTLLGDGGYPRRVIDEMVTWNLFPMLGANALYGRVFLPEEDRPGHERVALLSFRFWQERFGGDRRIVGRDLRINDRASTVKYTVVGIMPPRFSFPEKDADIWTPRAFTAEQLTSHWEHYLVVVGRLRQGVSLTQANANLLVLADQTRRQYDIERSLQKFFAEPLQKVYTRDARRGLMLLMTAVGFILLIACANLANLLLSRSGVRQREFALRSVLGASRSRIVRQLLTECAMLAVGGGALGIALAESSFVLLKKLIPAELSSTISLSLNFEVLAFVLVVSLASSIFFGLSPALRLSGRDLNAVLKKGTRGSSVQTRGKLGSPFVVGEIALSLLLLVGAGLLLRSFLRLRFIYPGFSSDHVLVMDGFSKLSPPDSEYAQRMEMFDRMLENVRALPGVKSAGFTSALPLGWKGGGALFAPEGAPVHPDVPYGFNDRVVTPGYFETVRMSLVHGRLFDQHDRPNAPPVVIINETMARKFWPNQDPLGKRLKFGGVESPNPWAQIVGIVGDVRQMGLDRPPAAEMYFPAWQARGNYMTPHGLVIRTEGEPMALAGAVRKAIWSVDADQPADKLYPLDGLLDSDLAPRRVQASLVGCLAILALVLACVGIYGVMAYLVAQRTQEMGIRMALGAQRKDVLALILGRGMKIACLGIVIGLIGAAILTRLLASLLFGISPTDPLTYGGVSLLLLIVALIASYIPARAATRVDPMLALRHE